MQELLRNPVIFWSEVILIIWLISTRLAEYIITEIIFIIPRFSAHISTISLFIIVVLVSALVVAKKAEHVKPPFTTAIQVQILLGITIFAVAQYQSFYSSLQEYPKIKSLNKNWSIQGDRIAIDGKNFGPAWQPGKVTVGGQEFRVISWTDTHVVVEQPISVPVMSDRLMLCNISMNCSETIQFTIKHPSEVL